MNTKSLNTTAPLTAMIASHIAVGSSQSPRPAKAPARPREVESPHLRHRLESPHHNPAPKDLLCRRLSQKQVGQTFITNRTLNQSQIQRAYPKSYNELGLHLDHLVNSGFNGQRHEAADLETKLQGLEAALVNRKAKLSDGVYFRPCRGNNGKKFANSELWQKRDLVERVNDFNDYYVRNLDARALSLFPSNATAGQSGTFSKSREKQAIIDQLEKVNLAKQAIKLAENPRINKSHHCRHLEGHVLPEKLRALVDTMGLPWTSQVAYQSLHHDIKVCSSILKSLSERGDRTGDFEALEAIVVKLTDALNIREKFLTEGKYFQPCSSRGRPVWATDHKQRENILNLVYQFAEVRDGLVTQHRSALDLNHDSSVAAFCDRHPNKLPGSWKEAKQVVGLISQIKKMDRQLQMVENQNIHSEVDPSVQIIRPSVDLTAPERMRFKPTIQFRPCNFPGSCSLSRNTSITVRYEAAINDVGYGSQFNKPWSYMLAGLPAGIVVWDSGIQIKHPYYPGIYYPNPSTEITFFVTDAVAPGDYRYTMRFMNPDDFSLYQDLTQYLTVV